MLQISNYNPERQHLVVTQDNALNVAEGSVTESFGLGLAATLTQGMGLSKVDNVLLEKNTNQVNLLNSKLAQALVNLTPANLDEVVSLAKHVNQIGKTAHIGCSVCGVDLVRSDALHNYNDDLEQMNGISSRYLNIFENLISFGATPKQICDIVQWIVKRDETVPLDVKHFANKQDFVQGLRTIAADSHNISLQNWIDTLIQADVQKIGEYDQHKAARKDRRIPGELYPQYCKLHNSFSELFPLADLITSIRDYRDNPNISTGEFENWSDDQLLDLFRQEDLKRRVRMPTWPERPTEELKGIRKILQTNPDVLLAKYDAIMTEAKKFSDIVVKKLLLLDDRRITCLVDQKYYLFQLFFIFPQIYRCCVLIGGEEKAFQKGTIQSHWRDAYHEFRDSMRTILDLETLNRVDSRFADYLREHKSIGDMIFHSTPT